uniref:Uncharacterized protein n=1 Tax=Setaria italica TaxID=4555 RepID=K3YF28_SETIT
MCSSFCHVLISKHCVVLNDFCNDDTLLPSSL